MRTHSAWSKLPSHWIQDKYLRHFVWIGPNRSNNIAALMCLSVIAHNTDTLTGIARLTYDDFNAITSLSRTKISHGLKVLTSHGIIRRGDKSSAYSLVKYHEYSGWCKFPRKSMYDYPGNIINMFKEFKLRNIAELDAMKLLFLIAARRNEKQNITALSYKAIEEYSGISRPRIKAAISHLTSANLLYTEMATSTDHTRYYNGYRLRGIDSYKHAGTSGAIT